MPVPFKVLSIFGGNNQSGGPGALLPAWPSVRVTDSIGTGVDGDTILWQVVGGGSLPKSVTVTLSEFSKTGWSGPGQWRLGTSGDQRVIATHKQTGKQVTFVATLTGVTPPPPTDTLPPLPPDTLPPDSTVIPPPPAPPADTLGITVVASCNFNGTTLCAFRNNATAPNTACSFNGVAGQCSADQWLKNGQLAIRYQRTIPITTIDTNRQIDSPDAMVPHGGYLYTAASFYYPSIPADARQRIDSAYNYWMATSWADSTGNDVIAKITDDEHEDALKKGKYGARQLGPNGGGLNHWVMNWHGRILRYSFPMKYDKLTGTCVAGTGLFNVTQVPRGGLLDRWWRIVTLIKRSSGAAMPDGELTVWVNGQQFGPFKNVCTNADNVIQGFGRVSFGQQYQFKGFYYEMRLLDDVVVGKK